MVGLKRAREVVEDASSKVLASAQSAERSIVVAMGLAVVSLVVALIAVVLGVRRRV